jgi:hypothetical protein
MHRYGIFNEKLSDSFASFLIILLHTLSHDDKIEFKIAFTIFSFFHRLHENATLSKSLAVNRKRKEGNFSLALWKNVLRYEIFLHSFACKREKR